LLILRTVAQSFIFLTKEIISVLTSVFDGPLTPESVFESQRTTA